MNNLMSKLPIALNTFVELYKVTYDIPVGYSQDSIMNCMFGCPRPMSTVRKLQGERKVLEEGAGGFMSAIDFDITVLEIVDMILRCSCKTTDAFYQAQLAESIKAAHSRLVYPIDPDKLAAFEEDYKKRGRFDHDDNGVLVTYRDAVEFVNKLVALSKTLSDFTALTARCIDETSRFHENNIKHGILNYLENRDRYLAEADRLFAGLRTDFCQFSAIDPAQFYLEIKSRIMAVHLTAELSRVTTKKLKYVSIQELFGLIGMTYAEAGKILGRIADEELTYKLGAN